MSSAIHIPLSFYKFIGIFLGDIISIFAGLYLADKALIPIQSSWNKQQQFVADASHEEVSHRITHTRTNRFWAVGII
jgi:hypothetical protein